MNLTKYGLPNYPNSKENYSEEKKDDAAYLLRRLFGPLDGDKDATLSLTPIIICSL